MNLSSALKLMALQASSCGAQLGTHFMRSCMNEGSLPWRDQ